eukprot:7860652-Lingulodinium_polyedra.AAC.1
MRIPRGDAAPRIFRSPRGAPLGVGQRLLLELEQARSEIGSERTRLELSEVFHEMARVVLAGRVRRAA